MTIITVHDLSPEIIDVVADYHGVPSVVVNGESSCVVVNAAGESVRFTSAPRVPAQRVAGQAS